MLPELPADLREAQALGVSLFAGEAEGRFDSICATQWPGQLKPLYNYLNDLPSVEDTPTADSCPAEVISRTTGAVTSFDAGRGCPFQCSFCTIINVQGRKSRHRNADDVEADRPRQSGAGHPQLLHHGRQFRPQQELGADLRPADRTARTPG